MDVLQPLSQKPIRFSALPKKYPIYETAGARRGLYSSMRHASYSVVQWNLCQVRSDVDSGAETIGLEPVGNTPDEARKFLDEEIAKWATVISTAGVKAEQ